MNRWLLSLVIAAVVLAASASASASSGPSLTASVAGDSVRVVASWKPGCNDLGCGDTSLVAWEVAGRERPLKSTTARADTLWLPVPAWRDSTVVVVRVSTLRRGLVSAPETDTIVVRRLDAPPPPPDSLRLDTLALRAELERVAELDSFPLVVVRDTAGRATGALTAGEAVPLCALGRNRYTGKVWVLLPWGTTDAEGDRVEARCEHARALYESERSG